MSKAKKHVVFMTEDEMKSLSTLCGACLKMTESPFFARLAEDATTAREKLDAKLKEINGRE